jgi:hypothetical protein
MLPGLGRGWAAIKGRYQENRAVLLKFLKAFVFKTEEYICFIFL